MKRFVNHDKIVDAVAIVVGSICTVAFLLFAVWWCIG